ncbi:hypothetical protein AAE02nite_10240 [Adhaeribacter aerolatus]|uniref:ATPase dynein-related AAA domain-containing protein n=1 Tax=Adhaeribacter aerolatus TaxID=670289 RepID=A0A512AUJ6_9BACT|nr:AAA family ATPase [Adhaeribacter aerolatus]GEO03360.1 hypothetical protein AAE02nite_10240 [Adhaeribacter aerolatus]
MNREELKKEFLNEWPINRVGNMVLEEYTNLNKTSFCYWLESKTQDLGSIWGGSSFKFGIYRKNSTKVNTNKGYSSDNEYAWVTKYGKTADEAFSTVKSVINEIVDAAQKNELQRIDKVNLGPAYKWKVAFLYSDYKVVNIYKPEALQFAAESLGMNKVHNSPSSELHKFIMGNKLLTESYYGFTGRLWHEYAASLKNTGLPGANELPPMSADLTNEKIALNTILYGPPGTGKTFNTINIAVEISDPAFYEQNKDDRAKLRERYNQLLIKDWGNMQKGQIGFCTFHQNFTYEDFIEGIKPIKPAVEDNFLKYDVQDGIFKKITERAHYFSNGLVLKNKALINIKESDYQNANFYKISLGDVNKPEDQAIYDYCIENSCISIGFMGGYDLTDKTINDFNQIVQDNNWSRYAAQAMNYFNHYLQVGDYFIVSKGNYKVRAIGKVIGSYYYDENAPIPSYHFRKVEWLIENTEIPIAEIYQKALSQQTIYSLNKAWINKEFFVSNISTSARDNQVQNFVLIIDEINRGNISQIFGELITLIEKDKRAGKDEALEITLPYSKEVFSVPPNLYILGTMNTADRSVEALDTALRRRFSFIEMPPKAEKIKFEGRLKDMAGMLGEIDLVELLDTINKRIEKLLDKNHMIGHSYLMNVSNINDLKQAFYESIIPLLQEYFYGDFAKIGLVLGSGFFKAEPKNQALDKKIFADFFHEAIDELSSREVLRLKNISKMTDDDFTEALQKLLNKKTENATL